MREHVQRDIQQRHGGDANVDGAQRLDFFGLDGRRVHRDERLRGHDKRGYECYCGFFGGNGDDRSAYGAVKRDWIGNGDERSLGY